MALRFRACRGAAVCLLFASVLPLASCSQGALTDAERSRATTLPTPTSRGASPHRVLLARIRSLLGSRTVAVDEDLNVDGTERVARLSWGSLGRVVEASLQTLGEGAVGTQVFRSPAELIERPIGRGDGCWWQAGPELDRFDRPVAQDLAVLTSARATSAESSLLEGSVSALSVLRVLGTDAELRHRDLLPPAGARVRATIGTTSTGMLITMSWADLVTAAGNSSRHSRVGTWTFRFQTLDGPAPRTPPTGQVLQVQQTDPAFHSQLRACNAAIR
jgi:hypothetical protein